MLDKINIVKAVINKVYTEGIQRKNSLRGGEMPGVRETSAGLSWVLLMLQ